MMYLPQSIRDKLPPIGAHDGKDPATIPIIVKYFSLLNGWAWYATEGEQREEDFIFYGFVRGIENEMGYFTLSDMMTCRNGIHVIERDLYFGFKHTMDEAIAERI
jgi:hypothetical protein